MELLFAISSSSERKVTGSFELQEERITEVKAKAKAKAEMDSFLNGLITGIFSDSKLLN
ncbi:MAG TPA: hypothetical protein VJ877_02330 [Bacteroidales bacterium]|nr:hypothetical protein [Bacteroidales bacterium]